MLRVHSKDMTTTTTTTTTNQQDVPEALVGLLPSYWAHIPLLVAQIHDLHVINGFHCLPGSCIPVSRCCLVGCIVAYERKFSGSSFVLDDGTGLMDCIYWEDDQFRDALPALADESSETSLGVGIMVKVMGRLEGTLETGVSKREIRVSWCQPIHVGSHRRAAPFSLDTESRHVLKVAQHTHSSVQEVLEALGTHLQQQIVEQQDFPSADDTISAWRLFGVHCQCPSSYIKTDLLYCSCIATPESTDVKFCFRMKLLELLLNLADRDSLFYFQYRQLLEHQHHFDGIANHSNFNYLLLRTIGALRTDGIIALVDEDSDTYLLITYPTVLKPYVELLSSQSWEDSVIRSALQKNSPEFLRNVPKGKMQLVRRMLQEEIKKQQE